MKQCVAVRHVHFEDLGSFEAPIRKAGYSIRYLDPTCEDLAPAAKVDLTVFLGGPIGVYETRAYPFLIKELKAIESRLKKQLPTMGVCLGGQLIAAAAGAKVYGGKKGKEIGWAPLSFTKDGLRGVTAPLAAGNKQMLHWHGDTYDLPKGATLLASSQKYENQIFTIGQNVLAFQCHPEFKEAALENWLVGHACELAGAKINLSNLRKATRLNAAHLAKRGGKCVAKWLAQLKHAAK